MFETIFLYILVLAGCVITTAFTPNYIYGKCSKKFGLLYYFYVLLPILIYTLFWGLRYDVGADYWGYVGYFNSMPDEIEIGFKALNKVLKEIGLSHVSLFIVTSFFSIFSLFLIARNESKLFSILLIYFFFTTSFVFFTLNGIRQTIAYLLILILISKVNTSPKSNLLLIVLLAFAAWTFHKSAVVPITYFILLYILKPVIKVNKYLNVSILVVLTFFGGTLYDVFLSRFAFLFELLDYTGYQENISDFEKSVQFGSGLGMMLKLVLNSIVILYQDKIIGTRDKNAAYYFYMFFLLGIMLEPIIAENGIMRRMNIYFISTRFVVYSYLCTYLLSIKNKGVLPKIITGVFIMSLLLLYIAAILSNSNECVPYHSIFSAI